VIDEEEHEFQRLWGPWATLTPLEAASLLEGFPRPWWISGGWAIQAFAGVAPDGLRYLQPELALAHKARLARPIDDSDLAATLPLLDALAVSWLRGYVARENPSHPGGRCWTRPREERPGRLTAPRTLFAATDPSASPPWGQGPGSEAAGPAPRAASMRRCRG
jgi:hypothetical protein